MSEDILDYADLVARYESGLIENLRSFGFQTEYLDLWVPDEDLTRSLLNLFNAAAEVGQHSLAIRVPADALDELKQSGLPALAAKHGRLSIDAKKGAVVLRITDLRIVAATPSAAQTAAPLPRVTDSRAAVTNVEAPLGKVLRQPASLPEPYASALRAADKGSLAPLARTGLIQARTEIDGLLLEAAIEPKDHVIHGLVATGARSAPFDDLMLLLTHICRGLPVFETADHGAIRLEHLLRGDAPRPRPGIVIPEAVDPAFRFVSALLRGLLADYRNKTGYNDRTNTFDVTPGQRWMDADDVARRAQLADAFARAGFPPSDVVVMAIEYDVRVVVSLGEIPAKDPARALAVLERQMKHFVDGRLELFLSEVKDSNKLRRLSDQKGKTQ